MTGTCVNCGTADVELNEQGLCATCAAKQGEGDMGADTATTTEETGGAM